MVHGGYGYGGEQTSTPSVLWQNIDWQDLVG